eukprot:549051-Prymnesium_polylepis.1
MACAHSASTDELLASGRDEQEPLMQRRRAKTRRCAQVQLAQRLIISGVLLALVPSDRACAEHEISPTHDGTLSRLLARLHDACGQHCLFEDGLIDCFACWLRLLCADASHRGRTNAGSLGTSSTS